MNAYIRKNKYQCHVKYKRVSSLPNYKAEVVLKHWEAYSAAMAGKKALPSLGFGVMLLKIIFCKISPWQPTEVLGICQVCRFLCSIIFLAKKTKSGSPKLKSKWRLLNKVKEILCLKKEKKIPYQESVSCNVCLKFYGKNRHVFSKCEMQRKGFSL